MSSDDPGPTHSPYGQPDPYGQPPQGSPYGAQPSGQPYGYGQQPAYGNQSPEPGRRPGTVTAAAWIAIAFSGITGAFFVLAVFGLLLARTDVIAEMQRQPDFRDLDVDLDQAYGAVVAVVGGFALWCLIAIVLAVFVLRRSNVARILLVISSGVAAALSLLAITSGVSIVWLAASVATIVLLFVGNAGSWFKGVPAGSGAYGGYQAYGSSAYGSGEYPQSGQQQYGQQPYGAQPTQPYLPSGEQPSTGEQPSSGSGYEPYGQQPANPYGQQPPAGEPGGSDYPPKDYPGR
ncbi:hypothetical protein SAMN04489844_0999 [Nocardioides exalbidus]|uniref:Uncharacterized protein n=1 Tax=Nocardioides exalbidus TaxID=402596 RepID=A0A1H4LYP0_9ACTN|nr:DUF4064 domain-containing protein [Nocardioides exalbidus]SEB75833.1 hypothetical protein SAMN04489844_0999 [Nocardioides exalbidus]